MKTTFIKGDWVALCDRCGKKFHASELRETWEGYMVCEKDFETRHPQDFVKAKPDIQTPPWSRPVPEPTYITVTDVVGYDIS